MKEFKLSNEVLQALPPSIRRGIDEMVNRFLKMKYSLLSDKQFVDQIRDSIQTFFLALEEAHGNREQESRLADQLDGIEDGIQFIKGAISNRLLAGRYLYEPSLFNPHNMGPFSQLYSFYESFVDLFERLITVYNKKKNEPMPQSKINFLVDISTYSSVHAQQFVPYSTNLIPQNVIVGITINENAFFQVENTIVLLLHEIGHHVRPFERIRRNKILLRVVLAWLNNMVYGQLNDYLYMELSSSEKKPVNDEERQKIDAVRKHFEQFVFPAVNPILEVALGKYFEEFTKSKSVISKFGDINQYANTLLQFHSLLDFFLLTFSNELSNILFSPIKETHDPDQETVFIQQVRSPGVESQLVELLKKAVSIKEDTANIAIDETTVYFNLLCVKATRLFEPSNIFEDINRTGNLVSDRALDSYLKSLSLLGLNEASLENQNLFISVLVRCLKKAVETMKDNLVVDMLIRNIDESLAHMFWIRTLNIRDFESYWAIFDPLMKEVALSEKTQIKYFGIPNAIITEYFDLLRHGKPQERFKYKVPPFDDNTPLTRVSGGSLRISKEKWLQDLRTIVFIPVAEYFADEDHVFPENHLFQLNDNKPVSRDAKMILKLREKFKQFLENNEFDSGLARGIQMIGFFQRGTTV